MTDWRKRVREAVDELITEAWVNRNSSGWIERANEIQLLAREQIADDVFSTSGGQRDRVGRANSGWVSHHRPGDDRREGGLYQLWPSRTEQDKALEAEMEAVMQEHLEGEDRIIVRLAYEGDRLTERELAVMYNTSQPTMHRRLEKIRVQLREAMLRRYGMEEVPND